MLRFFLTPSQDTRGVNDGVVNDGVDDLMDNSIVESTSLENNKHKSSSSDLMDSSIVKSTSLGRILYLHHVRGSIVF